VGQERAAPGSDTVAETAADDLGRQAASRAAARVDQSGLPGERLAVLDHPDDVAGAAAQAGRVDHDQLTVMAEDFADVGTQTPGGRSGVQFGLDHDLAAHDVQAAGESESGSDL
jgi:hypothetical protein